jgi:hypothetical protein
VIEADADLKDAVIERSYRGVRRAPEELQGLVLLEEVARVQLLDAPPELVRRRLVATGADGLAGLGLALGAADGLAFAAALGGVRLRRSGRARSR